MLKNTTMKKLYILIAIPTFIFACKKDKAEDPDQKDTAPETCATISYSTDIQPIFNGSCSSASCHGGGSPADGIDLTNHAGASAVNSDRLLGSIKHEAGYENMPQIGAKLSDANIQKIECWIEQGKLNN